MGKVIYRDFKSDDSNLIEKSYIDGCFTQINCQIVRSWKSDKKEFERIKTKVEDIWRTLQFYKNI